MRVDELVLTSIIPVFSIAFPAVDWPSFRRLERNFTFVTAVRTSYLIHLAFIIERLIPITHLVFTCLCLDLYSDHTEVQ